MTKLLAVFCLLPLAAHSWLEHRPPFLSTYHRQVSRTILFSEQGASTEENPCWQDLYDEDCSMDKTYAASFVASEWLKKMPCAQGIADCDTPDDLKLPGNRPEHEAVDVMDFLNLKRAHSVDKKQADDKGVSP